MTRNSFPSSLDFAPQLNSLAKDVAAQLGCHEILTQTFLRWAFMAAQVFDYKQRNYGPGNIAKFGYQGVVIRLNDKLERLVNLLKAQTEPADETINDSLGDIANYGIIGLMCRGGSWPGVVGADVAAKMAPDPVVLPCDLPKILPSMHANEHSGCVRPWNGSPV